MLALNSSIIKQITDALFYSSPKEVWDTCGIVIVLGSNACEYRVQRAWELFKDKDVNFLVCGGNFSSYTDEFACPYKEATYMRKFLITKGIDDRKIISEENSKNTLENLRNAFDIISRYGVNKPIGIISAGFHMARVRKLTEELNLPYELVFIPAYGKNSQRDKWFLNDIGIKIVTREYGKGR